MNNVFLILPIIAAGGLAYILIKFIIDVIRGKYRS